MRDLLVRYLLGELNAGERQKLEAELSKSPDLRRELEYLRQCLPSTEELFDEEPRAGGVPPSRLAERTVERISDWEESGEPNAPLPSAACAVAETGSSTPYWSFVDLTVAGGVLLAVSMLFLPAMRQSRDASRRTVCADNMRQIGVYLATYSEEHAGRFPAGDLNDNAGMYSVLLVHEGIVSEPELRRLIICPSSPLAQEVEAGCVVVKIPTVEELAQAKGMRLVELRRVMGGSLAYRIGFVTDENKYELLRNHNCPRTPLMADEPRLVAGDVKPGNHGCGTNMLYQHGNVKFIKNCELRDVKDDPYLNDNGVPAPGCHPLDTVLVPSEAVPASSLVGTVFDGAPIDTVQIKPTR